MSDLGFTQKTAAIVVVGNEILSGKSQERNALFLIGELYGLGVALRRVVFIPDDVCEIAEAVRDCSARFDYVFTSGGIGPTHDDVTIEGVARALGRETVCHPALEAMIRAYIGDQVQPDDAKLRMANAPDGAVLICSDGQTWPVLVVDNVYVLPGVPELFRSKFESMRERFRVEPFHVRTVYTSEDEFDIAERLHRVAARHSAVSIGSYPSFSETEYRVRITIESKEGDAVNLALADLVQALKPGSIVRME